SQTAGGAQTITVTATDPYGNTDTTYTGDQTLTFSGASGSSNPVTAPTVTDKNGTARTFGTSETITFTSGVASRSLLLYKAETAHVAVTDGTITASTGGDRLTVAVSSAAATRLVVTGTGSQTAGNAQTITV